MIAGANLRILFVGDLTTGGNACSLVNGFRNLELNIRTVDTSSYERKSIGSKEWFYHKMFQQPSKSWENVFRQRLQEVVSGWIPDVLFCIKTIHIPQAILHSIPCNLRVHLSFDDVSNLSNLTRDYLQFERSWDIIFTSKIFNVPELQKRTKSQIEYFDNAFDEKLHFPSIRFSERKWDVGFVGAHRPDRHNLPNLLIDAGIRRPVIAGPRWRRFYPFGVRGVDLLPELFGNAYTDLGNQIKLGLCLLNSDNRDQITMRSYELPALGQLVVGLETDQHLDLLENQKEAFWFKTLDEILQFGGEFQYRQSEFADIALAGTRRILGGKNTYTDRARTMYTTFDQV